MPTIGYILGSRFTEYITSIDHWIAFILLGFIGINMIKEATSKEEEEECDASLDVKTMVMLAIATSIDALAVGITFAFLNVQIAPAVSFIGIITRKEIIKYCYKEMKKLSALHEKQDTSE